MKCTSFLYSNNFLPKNVFGDILEKMFRRSISAMMADILCIERMCYLAVPNCQAIFLSSPTIHKKLVTPREAAQLPALAQTGQKVIFSTSGTFYLFPWFSVCFIVVSDPILLSLQSRGMLRHVSFVGGFFRMASPCWKHLLPHLHFMNILWCYCKWEFKQIVNTSLQFLRNGSVWIQHLSSLFPVNHCVLIRRRQQQLYISCMKLAMIG